MSCMYICFVRVYVYVYMYSCVILNNSALKFSRGRGHEARPWKSILQFLRNIFRYIQKRSLDPSIRVWTNSFACIMHSGHWLYLITGEFHVKPRTRPTSTRVRSRGRRHEIWKATATMRMVSTMWYAFVEIYLAKSSLIH